MTYFHLPRLSHAHAYGKMLQVTVRIEMDRLAALHHEARRLGLWLKPEAYMQGEIICILQGHKSKVQELMHLAKQYRQD